jgi:hypothetical protein
MSAKQLPSRVAVDHTEYLWEYRHGWLVDWGKGLKGISVSVALNPGKTRELILDFSFGTFGLDRNPPLAKVLSAIERGIREAIHAGWEPESRGRAFRHNVREEA